jgi:hypothetical protein
MTRTRIQITLRNDAEFQFSFHPLSVFHIRRFGVLTLRLSQVRRNRRVHQFLDLQAEVDRDGGSDHETDSGDELESEVHPRPTLISTHDCASADFIEGDPVDWSAVQPTTDCQFPSVQQEHEELVLRAEHFRQLSRSSQRLAGVAGAAIIASKSPLQHISNLVSPPLWRILVKVITFSFGALCVLRTMKRGSESECVASLQNNSDAITGTHRGATRNIGRAFSRPSIPGVIYVESKSVENIRRALAHVPAAYLHRGIFLVPPDERTPLLGMPADILGPGDWVRVKVGIYEGDPAYVTAAKNKIRLLLVPRISYEQHDVVTRPQLALFDPDRARAVFGGSAVQQVNNTLVFKRMVFKDGLLEKAFPRKQLIIGNVRPTLEEIESFSQSPQFPRHSRAKWEAEEVADALCLHDRIEVVEGDLKGKQGIITGKYRDVVQVNLSVDDHHSVDNELRFDIPAVYVRKSFEIGDYIRIRSGIHAGKYGYVMKISLDGTLEFLEWDKSGPHLPVRFLLGELHARIFSVIA